MLKVFSSIKISTVFKPRVDNLVFKLHYRFTNLFIFLCVILTTLYDIVGDKIKCITQSNIPNLDSVVNSYCLIMGTFTVEKHHNSTVGIDAAHQGVGPFDQGVDETIVHSYYQWVPFFLFGLGVLFYVPHWLWKVMEGGLFTNIIQDLSLKDYLSNNLSTFKNRANRFSKLSRYLILHMNQHRSWAYKFFFCELLNLGVALFALFSTDWFLGGEFLHYGQNVFDNILHADSEDRLDPMAFVFPRIAKCIFKMFGVSGTIETKDVMCLIPTNIINEKIFVFLWVWFCFILIVTSIWLFYRLVTIFSKDLQKRLLKSKCVQAQEYQINFIMDNLALSDWFLLCHLGKNMDSVIFSEFIQQFHKELYSSVQPKTDTMEHRL